MKKNIVLPILLRLMRLIVYLILCGFLIQKVLIDYNELKNIYDGDLNLLFLLKYFYFTNRFQVLIVLIGFAGFFIKKPVGWVMQSTFFYFFVFMPIFLNGSHFLFFEIVYFLLIPISFVFLMNLRVVTNEYNLKTENILTYNLGSIFSSLLITYLRGWLILNSNYSFWEIIEKINR